MRRTLLALALMLTVARPAAAQQTLKDVLSFLLTNRSIPTGDFAGDSQAAAAARDAITELLLSELTSFPINSPASGFTYRSIARRFRAQEPTCDRAGTSGRFSWSVR